MEEESIKKHPAHIVRFLWIRFHLNIAVNKKAEQNIPTGIIPIPKALIAVSLISMYKLLRDALNMVNKVSTMISINNLRRQEVTKKRRGFLMDGNLYIRFLLKDCKLLMVLSWNCNFTFVRLVIYASTFRGNMTGVLPVSL